MGPLTFRQVLPIPSKTCCRCPRIGPFYLQRQLPITSFGPVNVSVRCCRCPRIDQLHLQWQLPMSSLGPINVPAGAADTLRLAHCIYSCRCRWPHMGPLPSGRCCRCTHMGPLLFWEVLTMPSHGPINIPRDVADALGLAHFVCSGSCR